MRRENNIETKKDLGFRGKHTKWKWLYCSIPYTKTTNFLPECPYIPFFKPDTQYTTQLKFPMRDLIVSMGYLRFFVGSDKRRRREQNRSESSESKTRNPNKSTFNFSLFFGNGRFLIVPQGLSQRAYLHKSELIIMREFVSMYYVLYHRRRLLFNLLQK